MKHESSNPSRFERIRHVSASLIAALVCQGVSAVAGAAQPVTLPSLERVYVNSEPRPIADFVLTDHQGHERSFSSLRGEPVLVFFGFTHCPDICPPTLLRLRALHEAQDGRLRAAKIVMISVDGERDTPAALRAFLAKFSPDFIGLTGDPRIATTIAAQFSAAFFKEPARKDGNYKVGHSGQVFVVDRQGRLRASFVDASIDDMAKVLGLLIQERG